MNRQLLMDDWEEHIQVAGIIKNSNTYESAAAAGLLGSWDLTVQQYITV
jgi:hypothetical protein